MGKRKRGFVPESMRDAEECWLGAVGALEDVGVPDLIRVELRREELGRLMVAIECAHQVRGYCDGAPCVDPYFQLGSRLLEQARDWGEHDDK